MLSISQFTEKFLEQNLSKFLYHIEVTVRCRRGSGLSFLFTHFIVFTSFLSWSSPLTLFLSSCLPFSLVIPTSFRRFLTHFLSPFSILVVRLGISFLFLVFSPFPSSFFSLASHSFLLHSLPALPFLTFSLGSSPFCHPPPPPPLSSWSCISAYNKSRFVYPQYFENV